MKQMSDDDLLKILYRRYRKEVGPHVIAVPPSYIRKKLESLESYSNAEIRGYDKLQQGYGIPISYKDTVRLLRYIVVLVEIVR